MDDESSDAEGRPVAEAGRRGRIQLPPDPPILRAHRRLDPARRRGRRYSHEGHGGHARSGRRRSHGSLWRDRGSGAGAAADMGVSQSGVRQVANAAGTCDEDRIARTAIVVRRTALVLGVAGAILLAVLAAPVSELTFARAGHAADVALLSLAVLLSVIAGGQTALLQGLRRIGDLARIGILGAVTGTLVSLPIVYFWREAGVVPALVALSGISALLAWHCMRRLDLKVRPMRWRDMGSEVRELLRLGLAFMTSALLMMGAAYIVRALSPANRRPGGCRFLPGGLGGGWPLRGVHPAVDVDRLLSTTRGARSRRSPVQPDRQRADPRQHAAGRTGGDRHPGACTAPNDGPLQRAVRQARRREVLRWICLGMAMRVITWPMGFIVVAKNRKVAFVVVDLAWAFVNVALSWLLIELYGISGAGIAFFASYAFHAAVIYPVVRRMTGFAWSSDNVRTGLALVGLASAAFLACWHLPATVGFVVGLMGVLWPRVARTRCTLCPAWWKARCRVRSGASLFAATAPAMNIRSFSDLGPPSSQGCCRTSTSARRSKVDFLEVVTMSSVDVLIPCYRYGRYLQECVQSVLTQGIGELRVLILDDASPDDTPEVAAALARQDKRVTYRRHETNRGHIETYNEGIAWARADYMMLFFVGRRLSAPWCAQSCGGTDGQTSGSWVLLWRCTGTRTSSHAPNAPTVAPQSG